MDILNNLSRPDIVDWRTALVSILLAFALAQAVASVYMRTFRGLSYSRTLVQGMALASIVTCMLMLAIGNSIAAGIGIAGGLSIIRFRTTMRDPRDMVFVFTALAAGIATGLQAYAAAIAGTAVFLVAALALDATAFGARRHFDGLIRFSAPQDGDILTISTVLREHCDSFVLVTLREAAQGSRVEHAYQISIPNPDARSKLVRGIQSLDDIQDVTLLMQEPTLDL
ncbi:MAG: DUF4956 domain-containing protein [Myxococcota bacterium]|nr:DUF4956 domain-containing protein [Myxococcota bacterium]